MFILRCIIRRISLKIILLFLALPVVQCKEFENQGSFYSPVTLELSELPYPTGTIGSSNASYGSYYMITGLTPDQPYSVSLEKIQGTDSDNTGELELSIYEDSDQYSPWFYCIQKCGFAGSTSSIILNIQNPSETEFRYGATFTLNITATSDPVNWNTFQKPGTYDLTAMPVNSSVGNDSSYYRITGLTPGGIYEIKLIGTTSSTRIETYGETNYITCNRPPADDSTCIFGAILDYVEFTVTNTSDTEAGTHFDLSVSLSPEMASFGSYFSKLTIPKASLPFNSSVVDQKKSYFEITGLLASETYTLQISGLTDFVEIDIAGDCNVYKSNTILFCQFTVQESTLNFNIQSLGNGSFFTMELLPSQVSEGTQIFPINLTLASFPYAGTVGATESYYAVTGLSPETTYQITLTNLLANADLCIYSDSAYTILMGESIRLSAENEAANITLNATQTSLYIKINGSDTIAGSWYELNIRAIPANEGTAAAPIPLSFLASPLIHGGQVSDIVGSLSYYEVTGLSVGTVYEISLSEITSDADLTVFGSDSTFTTAVCASSLEGTQTEKCKWTATSPQLYVRADRFSPMGAYYRIQIK